MDKHSWRKLKRITGLAAAAAAALMLSVLPASAYYVDSITKAVPDIRVADVGLSGDSAIQSDTGDLDKRITPVAEGESFILKFSAVYDGNVDGIVVPCLKINIDNMADGDIIRVSDGESEVYIKSSEGALYSLPVAVSPGDIVEKSYRVSVVTHGSETPLKFDYDFSIAAAVKEGNEALLDEDGKSAYEDIINGDVSGFTTVADEENIKPADGGESVADVYCVRFVPDYTAGNTKDNEFRWYVKRPGGAEQLVSEKECLDLILNNVNIGSGLMLRYELENEAGYISSDSFFIGTNEDEPYFLKLK